MGHLFEGKNVQQKNASYVCVRSTTLRPQKSSQYIHFWVKRYDNYKNRVAGQLWFKSGYCCWYLETFDEWFRHTVQKPICNLMRIITYYEQCHGNWWIKTWDKWFRHTMQKPICNLMWIITYYEQCHGNWCIKTWDKWFRHTMQKLICNLIQFIT